MENKLSNILPLRHIGFNLVYLGLVKCKRPSIRVIVFGKDVINKCFITLIKLEIVSLTRKNCFWKRYLKIVTEIHFAFVLHVWKAKTEKPQLLYEIKKGQLLWHEIAINLIIQKKRENEFCCTTVDTPQAFSLLLAMCHLHDKLNCDFLFMFCKNYIVSILCFPF